ncbi:MAG: AraC family transcriptional regulator [Planctomycetaceae bacterium]|nr:AraC family transcriptional regulator [Planctomycetaceae bacterium]
MQLPSMTASICQLFDLLPDVQAWIKDRQGRYQWVNRGFLLNYSIEEIDEVVGKTDHDFSPRRLADQFRADDKMVLKGRAILRRVEQVGRFDHTAQWSVTSKLPLKDARGRIVATVGITCPLSPDDVNLDYPELAIGKVVAFIRRNVAKPISNEALAEAAGMSVRGLERKFRRCFGVSPQQYLRRIRVRLACSKLVHSGQSLSAIAAACGYCDQSHFSREFRRQTGVSPRQYRKEHRVGDA